MVDQTASIRTIVVGRAEDQSFTLTNTDGRVPYIPNAVADPSSGGGRSRDSFSGRMVRVSDMAAVFTTTEDPSGLVVQFRRSSVTPAPCA